MVSRQGRGGAVESLPAGVRINDASSIAEEHADALMRPSIWGGLDDAMDRFWTEIVGAVRPLLGERDVVVGPIDLAAALPLTYGYANTQAIPAETVDFLVLHKGMYKEIDPRFLARSLNLLTPCFANEVFILFAKHGEALPANDPHITYLNVFREWANRPPERPEAKVRLPGTYAGSGRVLTETLQGHLVVLPAEDRSLTPHVIRDGFFDKAMTGFIGSKLRPGDTFVDVGANVGLYSLLAANSVGPSGCVVAIEPSPFLSELLLDNVLMNGFDDRVVVVSEAVGRAPGLAKLYTFARHAGGATLFPEVATRVATLNRENAIVHEIKVNTLAAILNERLKNKPNLIKIDVEGAEVEVLSGAVDYLSKVPNLRLIVEWHPSNMSPEIMKELFSLLTDTLHCSVEALVDAGCTRQVTLEEVRHLRHADLYAYRGG